MITTIKEWKEVSEGLYDVNNIGKVEQTITIELDLKHTKHSLERQGRSTKFIKNSDIKETVAQATEQIIDRLIDNTLNAGDAVWVFNSKTNLNVIGSLSAKKGSDVITFVVITVMYHEDFYNKNNTFKITI